MSSGSSPSSGSAPEAGAGQSQNSTTKKITKYTVVSSLVGAVLTAAYESTVGRARAVRELEAKATVHPVDSGGHTAIQSGGINARTDASKFYRHNTALLSTGAALNSGLVALAFFNLREHVVSPALVAARYSEQNDVPERTLTWSAMRTHHLEDSALTGALLGGTFNAWKKGLMGIFPGMFTAALACTALQLAMNELGVQRVRYVSSRPTRPSVPFASQQDRSFVHNANGDIVSNASTDSEASPTSVANMSESESRLSIGERMLAFIGITKVDDVEYLRRLKAKREIHLARIRELEALEEARRASETVGDEEVPARFEDDSKDGGS